MTLPLTAREWEVSRLVAKGLDCDRIATALGIEPATARVHVYNIAAKLPNPDELKPYTLVLLWAAHAQWIDSVSKVA